MYSTVSKSLGSRMIIMDTMLSWCTGSLCAVLLQRSGPWVLFLSCVFLRSGINSTVCSSSWE
jgi:hypothetical protein